MELHQSLEYKRPGVYPGFDLPAPPLSSPFYTTFVDSGFAPPPFEVQAPPHQAFETYGFGSGLQIHNIHQEHSRKRRRMEKHVAMPPNSNPASGDRGLPKFAASPQHGQCDRGQASSWPQWTDSTGSFGQGMVTPLANWVTDLGSLLCPSCTNCRKQSDGYQSISDMPEMPYDTEKPHYTDKQPSVQMPLSNGYGSDSLGPLHTASSCCSQTNLVPDAPRAGATSNSLPLSNPDQNNNCQPGPSVQSYYSDEVGRSGSHYDQQPVMPRYDQSPFIHGPATSNEQALVHFGPTIPPMSGSQPLGIQDIVSPDGAPPYTLVPDGGLVDTVSPDTWDAPLYDQQPGGFDILLPNQRGGKRGPFKDPNLREQTAQTRKIGSCIRCRMQRIRCEHNPDEPGGPCLTCKRVTSTKTGRFPCLRYKITDIRLYKPGPVPGFEWTRRWNNNISDPVQQWASDGIKTVLISDGYSNSFIELRVRQFVPQDGDKLVRTWDYHGRTRSVTVPPYALMDLDSGKEAYTRHIESSMMDAFESVLGPHDGLLYRTYQRAWRLFKDSSTSRDSIELLHLTMKLWMSIRLSTTSGFIVGDETLGMPGNILDETSSDPGKIPVPPVLGAQLDLILIQHIQTKLRRELLDKLQKTVLKNKHSTWFVTYLVTFILLHNTALITAHDASYARKHGMKRRFAREDKVDEYYTGANILLAHFHYCNKGAHPFSDECRDLDLQSRAELDEDELQFVRYTRSYAKRHKREWEALRDQCSYEDDYFFVGQLFDDKWQPRSMS